MEWVVLGVGARVSIEGRLVGHVLVGVLDDFFEREVDGRGIEGFLGSVCVAEDGEDDVVGWAVVFVLCKSQLACMIFVENLQLE